jgi:hypothetical protein
VNVDVCFVGFGKKKSQNSTCELSSVILFVYLYVAAQGSMKSTQFARPDWSNFELVQRAKRIFKKLLIRRGITALCQRVIILDKIGKQ